METTFKVADQHSLGSYKPKGLFKTVKYELNPPWLYFDLMDAELTAYRKERKRVVLMTDNEERGTKRARKQELQRRRLVTACIEVNAAVADTAAFEAVIAGHKQMQFERECKEQAVAERGALFERTAKALHLSIKEMKKEVLREKLQGMRPEGGKFSSLNKEKLCEEILNCLDNK